MRAWCTSTLGPPIFQPQAVWYREDREISFKEAHGTRSVTAKVEYGVPSKIQTHQIFFPAVTRSSRIRVKFGGFEPGVQVVYVSQRRGDRGYCMERWRLQGGWVFCLGFAAMAALCWVWACDGV